MQWGIMKAKKTTRKKFKNRFEKFYYLNRDRINKKRRKVYKSSMKEGQCTRCKRKALKGITLCKYHRQKQKEYNARR